MDNGPYDVRKSMMVRRTVLLSKRNGQLQRLKTEYDAMYREQNGGGVKPLEASPTDDEIFPMTKRRRMQNFKKKFRAAMFEFTRLHVSDHIHYDN